LTHDGNKSLKFNIHYNILTDNKKEYYSFDSLSKL